MLGSSILDIAIGLAFLYVLLSVVCSAIQEVIATALRMRGETLYAALRSMLGAGNVDRFYEHPLIRSMSKAEGNAVKRPSYLADSLFADTVIWMIGNGRLSGPDATPNPGSKARKASERGKARTDSLVTLKSFVDGVNSMPSGPLKQSLATVLVDAPEKIEDARQGIEHWFNDSMDRASGWYKRRTQLYLFAIAAVIVVALNADTISIARSLAVDSELREAVVQNALAQVQWQAGECEAAAAEEALSLSAALEGVNAAFDNLEASRLPLSWSLADVGLETRNRADPLAVREIGTAISAISLKIPGLLLTIFAVSLGAPFWFDVLNKLANLRGAGRVRKPRSEESEAEDDEATAGGRK